VQHRQQQPRIGARPDRDVLEVTGGLGAAAVDADTAAPLDDGLQSMPDSRGDDQ
jgi:hypothetical protein